VRKCEGNGWKQAFCNYCKWCGTGRGGVEWTWSSGRGGVRFHFQCGKGCTHFIRGREREGKKGGKIEEGSLEGRDTWDKGGGILYPNRKEKGLGGWSGRVDDH